MFDKLRTSENQKVKIAFPKTANHVIACDLRSKDWENVYNQTVIFINKVILKKEQKFNFDLQGHRGARGLEPDNTMKTFKNALNLGVNTLELDVVISKDKKIVISHEPWLNHKITLDPKGNKIPEEKALVFNIYKNKYKKIKSYYISSIRNPKFPKQQKTKNL